MQSRRLGFTLIELLVAISIVAIIAAILLPGISSAFQAANRYSCGSNMRQLAQAFQMFASESGGSYPAGAPNQYWGDPRLTGARGTYSITYDRNRLDASYDSDYPVNLIRNNYIFDANEMFPEYLGNLGVLVCPAALPLEDLERDRWYMDETFAEDFVDIDLYDDTRNDEVLPRLQGPRPDWECVTSQMYTYLPYAVTTEEQALFLWDEINRMMFEGNVDFMDEQIVLSEELFEEFPDPDSVQREVVPRDDERFGAGERVRDRFERREGHAPGGGNVYYRTGINIGKVFVRNIGRPGDDYEPDTDIPVLFDTVARRGIVRLNHFPPGGNVLYLDGHVEFQKFEETESPRFNTIGRWTFFSFNELPYTTDFVEFLRANLYDNTALINVPPWCSNRLPGTRFEPRYWYYPDDPLYEGLFWDSPTLRFQNRGLYQEDLGAYEERVE